MNFLLILSVFHREFRGAGTYRDLEFCPHQFLAENWLLFGTPYLRKVSRPCGPSMMELLKTCRKPARNPWQSSGKSVVFRDLNRPFKCRTGNTNNLFLLSKTCCSRFPGDFLRVAGYFLQKLLL